MMAAPRHPTKVFHRRIDVAFDENRTCDIGELAATPRDIVRKEHRVRTRMPGRQLRNGLTVKRSRQRRRSEIGPPDVNRHRFPGCGREWRGRIEPKQLAEPRTRRKLLQERRNAGKEQRARTPVTAFGLTPRPTVDPTDSEPTDNRRKPRVAETLAHHPQREIPPADDNAQLLHLPRRRKSVKQITATPLARKEARDQELVEIETNLSADLAGKLVRRGILKHLVAKPEGDPNHYPALHRSASVHQ